MAKKDNQPSTPREEIYAKHEASRDEAPVEEPKPQETPEETAPEKEEQVTPELEKEEGKEPESEEGKPSKEEPKRKFAETYDSVEDLEKGYLSSRNEMHLTKQQMAEMNKQFQALRPYINWDRLQSEMRGEKPQESAPQSIPKEKFFEEFAEKGGDFLPQYLNPHIRRAANEELQRVMPQVVNTVAFNLKMQTAYESFSEKYPELKPFEEDVGRMMLQDISQNPRKDITKAMHDAAKRMQGVVDGYVEKGRQNAQTEFTDKKKDNLPPTSGTSKDKLGVIKKTEKKTEEPETLDDYMKMRRELSNRFQSGRR